MSRIIHTVRQMYITCPKRSFHLTPIEPDFPFTVASHLLGTQEWTLGAISSYP